MDNSEFRRRAHELVDWMADYLENVRDYPVKSQVDPGDILSRLPNDPPEEGESFDGIMNDFNSIVMPGITHWQHPRFMAYWPANSSPPSVLAEMLTATLATQCMIWQTSPAAAELEERVMQWLGRMIGIPDAWDGVIQDTASTATLCSILTAREKYSEYRTNARGLVNGAKYAVYGSTQTHSSIDKAVKIAGLGSDYLRKVDVDGAYAMKPEALEAAIVRDKEAGVLPLCVIATLGTTGTGAIDPLRAVGEVCHRHNVWLHVDAAYAGTALILPEMRRMIDGIEHADTFVVNPHKWMFTNFDCSAYFVKDRGALIQTFEIMPEYLKTKEAALVNNYRDWGIALGRRFRALKLWFVLRSYGVEGIRKKLRSHLAMAASVLERIEKADDFELLAPAPLNLLCFRYHPAGVTDSDELNSLNEKLLEEVNRTGKLFITHTKLDGVYTLRLVTGQTNVTQEDVDTAWELIAGTARGL
jgi:aromatic-L-amino-acid decarboxylase